MKTTKTTDSKQIGALAAREHVSASVARDPVVARAAIDPTAASLRRHREGIIARAAADRDGARRIIHRNVVVALGADDRASGHGAVEAEFGLFELSRLDVEITDARGALAGDLREIDVIGDLEPEEILDNQPVE